MSGVRVGNRLDHLYQLRARLDQEIYAEQRRQQIATPIAVPRVRRPGRKTEDAASRLLEDLGVTSRQVKEWSVTAGINAEVPPGRVSLHLVQAYAHAQPQTDLDRLVVA